MHAQWRRINFWSEVPFEEQEPTYIIESILVQGDEQSAITDRHPCMIFLIDIQTFSQMSVFWNDMNYIDLVLVTFITCWALITDIMI